MKISNSFENNTIFVIMRTGTLIGSALVLLLLIPTDGMGQMFEADYSLKYDTSYIKVYKDELTTRLYLSRKQNGLNLKEELFNPWIQYRTNDNLLLGIGYTYSFLTLNLAVKLPFINVDEDLYGTSHYIDLQSHTIFRSTIIDLYLQWNKGFYISNPEDVFNPYVRNPVKPNRGDLRTSILDLNVQYLFNSRRYSYKAAFLQNEFQKKSAGSAIAGAESYWLLAMSDSATVGRNIPPVGFLGDRPFNQTDVLNLGINGGYAYTFVWQETLYLSLSTIFGVNAGQYLVHNTPTSETLSSKLSFGFTNSTRISFGFNSRHYYVGVSYIRFGMTSRIGFENDWIGYSTGNIRFNLVKRFITKRPIKALRPDLWILN